LMVLPFLSCDRKLGECPTYTFEGHCEMLLSRDFTIETIRCRLRCVTESDIPHIFSASRYAGFTDGMLWEPPQHVQELYAPHLRTLTAWDDGVAYCFTIETKNDGIFIGRISLRYDPQQIATWNLGFWTHPVLQRQGFMTEAATAILTFGFNYLHAARIEACHAVWNIASETVLTKIGLRFQRHIPQGYQKRGEWIAENLLALDRTEWELIEAKK